MIDYRSDTVTKPTDEMRRAMFSADVGDDVMNADPTVIVLQSKIATMFEKEDALFFPSATMANLVSVLVWCGDRRDAEIIVGDRSHMFLFEQGGAAQFGGVSSRSVPNLDDGTMSLDSLRRAIRDDDIHEPVTKMIAVENTHNCCGGTILPIDFLIGVRRLADEHHIPVHMDGARIWNALTATSMKPHEVGQFVDSLSVCLSKGLGAPVGSVLIGPSAFITKARRVRKALGGGWRQAGVLAAAGLQALADFEEGILNHDHRRTQTLVSGLKNCHGLVVSPNCDTNIAFITVDDGKADVMGKELSKAGVLVSVWDNNTIRMVVHRDLTDENINNTISIFKSLTTNPNSKL
jgi:threonine aldolase